MFKNKRRVEKYRKFIKELEEILDSDKDNATKIQVIKNLTYVITINDLLDL